jgi:hypothetical protein
MGKDHVKRFTQWRATLPENSLYLTNLVNDLIVPEFHRVGFQHFPDYAAGSAAAVGPNCLPLQRRTGEEWPTVEIWFDRRKRPSLGVHFAALPEICFRVAEQGYEEIPRIEANVTEGVAFFSLCKGRRRNFDCSFGIISFSFWPKRKLDEEVANLRALLPWLFGAFEKGIPDTWHAGPGYVDVHAFQSPASRILLKGVV